MKALTELRLVIEQVYDDRAEYLSEEQWRGKVEALQDIGEAVLEWQRAREEGGDRLMAAEAALARL